MIRKLAVIIAIVVRGNFVVIQFQSCASLPTHLHKGEFRPHPEVAAMLEAAGVMSAIPTRPVALVQPRHSPSLMADRWSTSKRARKANQFLGMGEILSCRMSAKAPGCSARFAKRSCRSWSYRVIIRDARFTDADRAAAGPMGFRSGLPDSPLRNIGKVVRGIR